MPVIPLDINMMQCNPQCNYFSKRPTRLAIDVCLQSSVVSTEHYKVFNTTKSLQIANLLQL